MRKTKKSKTGRLTKWVVRNRTTLVIGMVVLALACWIFGSNFVKIVSLTAQKNDLESQITQEQKKGEQLDEDIKQIGTKDYYEYIARKNLGLYYPDEKIVVTVKNEQGQSTPTSEPTAQQ
ncbi:MAG: septum formation initiator family protein [Eubacteriaceae bacterium]|nr:septum formation initiator family protein [Eubacteriaceae bacterium]